MSGKIPGRIQLFLNPSKLSGTSLPLPSRSPALVLTATPIVATMFPLQSLATLVSRERPSAEWILSYFMHSPPPSGAAFGPEGSVQGAVK